MGGEEGKSRFERGLTTETEDRNKRKGSRGWTRLDRNGRAEVPLSKGTQGVRKDGVVGPLGTTGKSTS